MKTHGISMAKHRPPTQKPSASQRAAAAQAKSAGQQKRHGKKTKITLPKLPDWKA